MGYGAVGVAASTYRSDRWPDTVPGKSHLLPASVATGPFKFSYPVEIDFEPSSLSNHNAQLWAWPGTTPPALAAPQNSARVINTPTIAAPGQCLHLASGDWFLQIVESVGAQAIVAGTVWIHDLRGLACSREVGPLVFGDWVVVATENVLTTTVLTANFRRRGFALRNMDSVDSVTYAVPEEADSVVAGEGFVLGPGDQDYWSGNDCPRGYVRAIADGAAANVAVCEAT